LDRDAAQSWFKTRNPRDRAFCPAVLPGFNMSWNFTKVVGKKYRDASCDCVDCGSRSRLSLESKRPPQPLIDELLLLGNIRIGSSGSSTVAGVLRWRLRSSLRC
jgi:hypothetical protein